MNRYINTVPRFAYSEIASIILESYSVGKGHVCGVKALLLPFQGRHGPSVCGSSQDRVQRHVQGWSWPQDIRDKDLRAPDIFLSVSC